MQWFIKEQIEEVASMSDLLRVVERSRENPMFAEDFLAREQPGDGGRGRDRARPRPAARCSPALRRVAGAHRALEVVRGDAQPGVEVEPVGVLAVGADARVEVQLVAARAARLDARASA